MQEDFIPDELHLNFVNGRRSPFKALPHNEMMLMTDRRARQFLHKVIAALNAEQSKDISGDYDLTLIDFWAITQDVSRQWEDFSEYDRPWEYHTFPAIKDAIMVQWKACMEAHPNQKTILTGEQVANIINTVILRKNNVPIEGVRMVTTVTQWKTAFQPLRDHFAETVAPYRPTQIYNTLVYGNPWQSLIADCMDRRDREGLSHIIAEGKKLSPEGLSDAIAHMCICISWGRTHAMDFDADEVQILASCIPHMIFSKENTQSALSRIFTAYQVSDQYWLYDAALDTFIINTELQTDKAILGYDMGNWDFEHISALVSKLKNWGVSIDYIISRVFFCHLTDCRQDVWEKIWTLLPDQLSNNSQRLVEYMKENRKTAKLEKLSNTTTLDEASDSIRVELPLGIYHMKNGQWTFIPFPLTITVQEASNLAVLPDFYYTKPEPTELGTWYEKTPTTREKVPQSGYKFIWLIQTPTDRTWIKLPNYTHRGPNTELALVALAPDNQSRFFSFDCLDEEFKNHLLSKFSVIWHDLDV